MFLEGSNCALFVFIYMCTARHRGDAQQIFVEQTDDPNNPDRYLLGCICCVCSVSLWRLMTRSFSRWCPVAWRLAPLSTMQHSLPGEEQRSAWLALALEDFNLFGPQVKISGFKMSPGSCIFFGWWLVFVSTGAHISYGMSLWDLIASYCPTHTGAARGLLKCKFGLCHTLGGSLSFQGKVQISHHGSWTGCPGSLCLLLLSWASPFTPKGVSGRWVIWPPCPYGLSPQLPALPFWPGGLGVRTSHIT